MKNIINIAFILLGTGMLNASAQPVINNAGNYNNGMNIQFVNCDTTNLTTGSSGSNITWNFTSLTTIDTLTCSILHPGSTSYGTQFPEANLVEKYSDGRYIFLDKNDDSSQVTGYIDSLGSLSVKYPDYQLLYKRPLAYGDLVNDSFSLNYIWGGYPVTGTGTTQLSVDGYGSLQLPYTTHNDVVRVKLIHRQKDSVIGISYIVETETNTYIWFNNNHISPLCKIDSIVVKLPSHSVVKTNVNYLHKEYGVTHVKPQYGEQGRFFASLNNDELLIKGPFTRNEQYDITMTEITGRTVLKKSIVAEHNTQLLRLDKTLDYPMCIVIIRDVNNQILQVIKLVSN